MRFLSLKRLYACGLLPGAWASLLGRPDLFRVRRSGAFQYSSVKRIQSIFLCFIDAQGHQEL